MKKSIKISFVLLLFTAFSFVPTKDKKVIVLDAGHGGNDSGAQFENLKEKDLTLKIADKIIRENKNPNVEFVLLRDEDESLDLHQRVERINELNPDMVISLHLNNAKNVELNGVEVYYSEQNAKANHSKKYAGKLIKNFRGTPLKSGGVKSGDFKILRDSNVPSVILELGYISNPKDREYVSSDFGQNEIAKQINSFVQDL
jgi:N-acetylmuramoyl-L-alanine amidase